ncbi:MAG: hypothetical protein A2275_02715 [Bacteroidetes bacterium RIFOXYA12_FULL_35_11]|nr:MAG: hypothetical protein A2X01_07125 [Bacteroidetes bacterium GWF2_35_48]OFY82113.1 MAG: hypothetical protein A2275_02715 [Bacteroidetes bacterium RIFOXYA12_FULL_35_11]OFZ03585.1 MAG: hypothetical protein A2491_05165 [Bacteroidetes bacterium RIFOXYC12_FULL_35_7]HBX53158.1 hypothetical protein [Bacteroidales bacterium]
MKKIFSTLFLLAGINSIINAQQVLPDEQFLINKFSLSPAYAGFSEMPEVYMGYRQEWRGINGAPTKAMVNFNTPLASKMGIGGTINYQQYGIFSQFSLSLAYAYRIIINDNQMICLGLSAGINKFFIGFNYTKPQEQIDPVVASSDPIRNTTLDAAFGAAYKYRKFNTGISVMQLPEGIVWHSGQSVYAAKRYVNIHATYLYDISRNWQLEPCLVTQLNGTNSLVFQFATLVKFKEIIWLGGSIKKRNEIGMIFGLNYKNIILNYSYNFGGNGLVNYSSGSQEITLGYKFDKNKKQSVLKPDQPYNKWID